MDLISLPNSRVEIITHDVLVFEGGSLGGSKIIGYSPHEMG